MLDIVDATPWPVWALFLVLILLWIWNRYTLGKTMTELGRNCNRMARKWGRLTGFIDSLYDSCLEDLAVIEKQDAQEPDCLGYQDYPYPYTCAYLAGRFSVLSSWFCVSFDRGRRAAAEAYIIRCSVLANKAETAKSNRLRNRKGD